MQPLQPKQPETPENVEKKQTPEAEGQATRIDNLPSDLVYGILAASGEKLAMQHIAETSHRFNKEVRNTQRVQLNLLVNFLVKELSPELKEFKKGESKSSTLSESSDTSSTSPASGPTEEAGKTDQPAAKQSAGSLASFPGLQETEDTLARLATNPVVEYPSLKETAKRYNDLMSKVEELLDAKTQGTVLNDLQLLQKKALKALGSDNIFANQFSQFLKDYELNCKLDRIAEMKEPIERTTALNELMITKHVEGIPYTTIPFFEPEEESLHQLELIVGHPAMTANPDMTMIAIIHGTAVAYAALGDIQKAYAHIHANEKIRALVQLAMPHLATEAIINNIERALEQTKDIKDKTTKEHALEKIARSYLVASAIEGQSPLSNALSAAAISTMIKNPELRAEVVDFYTTLMHKQETIDELARMLGSSY